jgi:hypothetical protein
LETYTQTVLIVSTVLFGLSTAAWALCPLGMADIDGKYCVDKHEGALVETTGGATKPWPHYLVPLDSATYQAVSGYGRVPQGYISGAAAAKACENAGKRLCTAAEWVKACRGSKDQDFPYGPAFISGVCNEHGQDKSHKDPMHRLFGATPRYDLREMNDPRLDQLPDTVAPSGSFPGCVNDYSVRDMVGNLHEWVSDVDAKGLGRFNGGYFNEADKNGPGCRYKTTAHAFQYHDYSTGFRCCRDPLK